MKITVDKALIEQAIEALPDVFGMAHFPLRQKLRKALEEVPVVEPVAEVKVKMTGGNAGIATVIHEIHDPLREPLSVGTKLYTSPPPPVEEPVAHATVRPLQPDECERKVVVKWVNQPVNGSLFAAPPPTEVPMIVDDDIWMIALEANEYPIGVFARAIEALVRQKAGVK